ncbi:hypothetical protein A1O7_08973 [Cladophialophora yegresii CBS 114405]|uniref:Uncharacterized protein n=1 Tax=Cladophialophora yegresii CBS 114405 TaxID=1182544 RepID=W9VK23_9EURO|nr:uncharacterized protein A1O7_08973 [Cladophialophora yegresii CBS 114405]EXJ56042.1 hypothetical protein A1O7_08973 [Cladophialophora yegresii CBS 114405]
MNGYRVEWMPKSFSSTIVAATVVKIVNTDQDTTRLSNIYNEIPAGYTVSTNTNTQGMQTLLLTYYRTGKTLTSTIAFPTQFNANPDEYFWTGVLPTVDAAGVSVCSTAPTSGLGTTVSVDYWSQDSMFTTPTYTCGPDPGGLLFTTSHVELESRFTTYKTAFLDEAAL